MATNLSHREEVEELSKGYLDESYQIQLEAPIAQFSTLHAKAYEVVDTTGKTISNDLYALIFEPSFPTRLRTIKYLKSITHPSIQRLINYGKIVLSRSKTEKFAVILQKPKGITLEQHILNVGRIDEQIIANVLAKQLSSAMTIFTDNDIVHGSINPTKIYIVPETNKIVITECISDICGNSQFPGFDAINQLICRDDCKGGLDLKSDYYSIGVLILYMLSGQRPFVRFSKKLTTQIRLKNGSYESTIVFIRMNVGFSVSRHMDNLVKGLTSDNRLHRWTYEEFDKWHDKEEPTPLLTRIHKQGATGFSFGGKDYYSRKHLAHMLAENWDQAKKEVKLADVARWLLLSLKEPDAAENMTFLANTSKEIVLPDNKLVRLITLLDPDGPIRYQNFSGHIGGIGFALANSYINKEEKNLQQISNLLNSGLLEYWVNSQDEDSDFKLKQLQWRPNRLRKYMAKKGIGFGTERSLYELNPGMPCQSPLLENFYVVTLEELLESLDRFEGNTEEKSPVDRHIGAFIASRIDMVDDLRIKSLQNFPYVAKNPEVLNVGMLSVAQAQGAVPEIKGLTVWMNNRLESLVENLNSRIIKKQFKRKLDKVSTEGDMGALFKVLSNPDYARRDLYGFQEARAHYRNMSNQVTNLQTQSNIQRMAYQLGLRVAVSISYLVCSLTFVYVMIKAVP